MKFKFEIIDDREVSDELMRLAKAASPDTLNDAITEGSEIVLEGIRNRIRSDARRKTGALEGAIKYRIDSDWLSGRAVKSVFGWDKKLVRRSREGKPTYTTDYGPVLEYDSKRQLRHLEAGFDDTQQEAENRMASIFNAALESADK